MSPYICYIYLHIKGCSLTLSGFCLHKWIFGQKHWKYKQNWADTKRYLAKTIGKTSKSQRFPAGLGAGNAAAPRDHCKNHWEDKQNLAIPPEGKKGSGHKATFCQKTFGKQAKSSIPSHRGEFLSHDVVWQRYNGIYGHG